MENQANLVVQEEAKEALRSSAKWSMFLSIIGFIGIGIMLLASLVVNSAMSSMPETPGMGMFGNIKGFISAVYVLMAILYIPPIYYMFKYATEVKNSLMTNNSDILTTAFVHLKGHHKSLGISVIILISMYLLLILGMIAFFVSKGVSGM